MFVHLLIVGLNKFVEKKEIQYFLHLFIDLMLNNNIIFVDALITKMLFHKKSYRDFNMNVLLKTKLYRDLCLFIFKKQFIPFAQMPKFIVSCCYPITCGQDCLKCKDVYFKFLIKKKKKIDYLDIF